MVDSLNGPIKTIDEALERIKPNTTIFLAEGVYFIKKTITVPGLIFMKKDNEKKVYVIGNEGPVVTVKLFDEQYVVFKDIIFMHSGANIWSKFKENAPNDPKYCPKPCPRAIREFEINPKMDTVFWI